MGLDRKQFRSLRRRWWKKIKPKLGFGITISPAVFAALLRLEPQTAPLWTSLVMGASAAQMAKDTWKGGKDRRRIQDPKFFGDYIELLSKSVGLMQDVKGYSVPTLQFMEQSVLEDICTLVALYYEEHDKPELKEKFNANIMIPLPRQDWIEAGSTPAVWKPSVRFTDSNRHIEACSHILHLTDWARTPQNWSEFVLPVEKSEEYLLLGAPRAFAQDKMQVCSDTLSREWLDGQMSRHPDITKRELHRYFEDSQKTLRSFFCLPLHADKDVVGVLNVQSADVDILGVDEEHREDLEMCLRPFCTLLAALIVHENEARRSR